MAAPGPPTDSLWRAPLVPAALAVTAGIVLDRYLRLYLAASLALACLGLLAWCVARRGAGGVFCLAVVCAGCGAAWHHLRRDVPAADDVGEVAPVEPLPVQVRGVVAEEPVRTPAVRGDPLRTLERPASVSLVLRATHVRRGDDWEPVSGRLRLVAPADADELHVGDAVEAVGLLAKVGPPANPGEFDLADHWRDQGVRAQLVVRKTPEGLTRLESGQIIQGRRQRAAGPRNRHRAIAPSTHFSERARGKRRFEEGHVRGAGRGGSGTAAHRG